MLWTSLRVPHLGREAAEYLSRYCDLCSWCFLILGTIWSTRVWDTTTSTPCSSLFDSTTGYLSSIAMFSAAFRSMSQALWLRCNFCYWCCNFIYIKSLNSVLSRRITNLLLLIIRLSWRLLLFHLNSHLVILSNLILMFWFLSLPVMP